MAGVVPKKSTSGRKQWTLQGGPKSSLKRLRNQLASDGCPESQVVLAKQLLHENCDLAYKKKENARLGVYWLIKASEQGNLEATDLLKTCLQTGRGITEHNYMDVKSCISMTQDEKIARKAAREMFASLSNGEDYITSDQLQKKMLAIDKGQTCSKSTETTKECEMGYSNGDIIDPYDDASESEDDTDWSQKSDSGNEKLTEDSLVSAAVDFSHGHLPIVNRILCLSHPNLKALDHIPFVHWSILHPLLALKILYFKLMKFLAQKAVSLLFPLAKSEIQLVVLICIYTFFNSGNIIYIFPMVLYFASLLTMIVLTFQMLQNKRDYLDFRLWSGLFICYSGGSLNADQAEFQYVKNNLKPYVQFFLCLIINVIVYPLVSQQWIPHSELTVIAFCFTFITLLGFMPTRRSKTIYDGLLLLSFAVNVLAKYPYETDPVVAQGWRFLDVKVPNFPSYVIGNGIEFCINFKLVLYSFIPLILLRIAARHNWRGIYKSLIPHCVTLSWLQICIISSQGATMFGCLRGTLALVGVVLFLPLVGLTSVMLPVIAVTKYVITSSYIYSICLFLILSSFGLGICYILAQTRYKKFTAIIQVVLMFIAFFFLINSTIEDRNEVFYEENKVPSYMSWDVYQRFCFQPVFKEENVAIQQMKCAELEDTNVNWEGFINDIKIKSIKNRYKNIFNKLPRSISQYLYCLYGEEILNDCQIDSIREECSNFFDSMRYLNKCTLEKYNKYTFEIGVRMEAGIWAKKTEVKLHVDDHFKNFTLKLKPHDHIWFKGKLMNNEALGTEGVLGGNQPYIELEEIGCIECENTQITEMRLTSASNINLYSIFNAIHVSTKFLLNVLFNPIVVFK